MYKYSQVRGAIVIDPERVGAVHGLEGSPVDGDHLFKGGRDGGCLGGGRLVGAHARPEAHHVGARQVRAGERELVEVAEEPEEALRELELPGRDLGHRLHVNMHDGEALAEEADVGAVVRILVVDRQQSHQDTLTEFLRILIRKLWAHASKEERKLPIGSITSRQDLSPFLKNF